MSSDSVICASKAKSDDDKEVSSRRTKDIFCPKNTNSSSPLDSLENKQHEHIKNLKKSVWTQCGHFLTVDEENIIVFVKTNSPVHQIEDQPDSCCVNLTNTETNGEEPDESTQHHPGSWYLPWGVPLQKMVAVPIHPAGHLHLQPPTLHMQPMLAGLPAPLATLRTFVAAQPSPIRQPPRKILGNGGDKDKSKINVTEKRKADDGEPNKDLKKAKLETKALKAKRPGFTDERYNETSYYIENGLRKVYPYYFTFTTFTKGRWVGERILDVFAREFRAHPAEEYERCIQAGTLTVNYEKVPTDYKLKHNDLLANIVHRHEVPVTSQPITIVHMDEDVVVVNKPASIPVHPCGRYRHNTVVFILAKEYNLKNLRTIHRLDRLTSGLLLFGRSPKKARQMEHQIRNRLVSKEYVCRVEGEFPDGLIECSEAIEVVSYKIGVCKVSSKGKDCHTVFQKLGFDGKTSVVLCKPKTGRMHQIRVHLQYLGYPVVNDPLYNHDVFGPLKGKGGNLGGKTDEELVRDLIHIHNAENWLGMDGDTELSMFNTRKDRVLGDDDADPVSREPSPCDETCDSRSSPPACEALPNPLNISSFATRSGVKDSKITVATQTGHEAPDFSFNPDKMSVDQHCYECKVRYRDPKPQDLVMYLHAWKYRGPGWEFETELPDWAKVDWVDPDISE